MRISHSVGTKDIWDSVQYNDCNYQIKQLERETLISIYNFKTRKHLHIKMLKSEALQLANDILSEAKANRIAYTPDLSEMLVESKMNFHLD